MKIFRSKKRLVVCSLAAVAGLGVTAVHAEAIGPELPLRGTGTLCLSPDAARTLAARNVTMQPIAPATTTATNCVTLPGSGTLSADLSGGEIPLQGGMRFSDASHRLDVTNLHIYPGKGSTTADFAQDGAAPTNIDFAHYEVSPRTVSISPSSVDSKSVPVNLTAPGAAAFINAFGTSPVAVNTPAFVFDGHAEIVNPFGDLPTR
ncbi:HtaA domain-containing protein [Streptomyces sp. NPDC046161]|uniref:HtaA domain-containing protein n=1 Tax=Streptomyces sp. NPDC046161 TaxID=3155132 RepID=UPI0033D868BC